MNKKLSQIYKEIGENIKRERKNRGLTLEQLGEDVGWDKAQMQKVEKGRNITVLTLFKLAASLEADPAKLIKTKERLTVFDVDQILK